MEEYEIHCTPQQTREALQLGAQIETFGFEDVGRDIITTAKQEKRLSELEEQLNQECHATIIGDLAYIIPTAGQMINWLEGQGFDFETSKFYTILEHEKVGTMGIYEGSRKTAMLIAIDKALDYLSNKK